MTDKDVRDFLGRMATEETVPFLDAEPLARRARRRAARTVVVGAVGVVAVIAALFAGATQLRQAAPTVPADPIPAPLAAGALAYALDGDIFVADPDGSDAKAIATAEGGCEYSIPSWSPDGGYLAFERDCANPDRTDVIITDPQGTLNAEFPKDGWGFAWSPDSTRIAVWKSWPKTIGVYGLDGERQEYLPLGSDIPVHDDSGPVWKPDGSALLLYGMFVVPIDGRPTYEWGVGIDPRLTQVVYSPDGSHVALIKGDSIDLIRAAGDSPVTKVEGLNGVDGWSWDGDRFASLAHGELNVVDVASGNVTVLTDAAAALDGADTILGVRGFSPQGDRILYETGDGSGGNLALRSIGVDGSDARLLVAGTTQGDWRSR